MKMINIYEAQTHLSRIIDQVAEGVTVLVGKPGEPPAMHSSSSSPTKTQKARALKGRIWMADDFDRIEDAIRSDFLEVGDPGISFWTVKLFFRGCRTILY